MLITMALCAGLLATTPTPTCKVTTKDVRDAIMWRATQRTRLARVVARILAPRITTEAKRHGLDPLVMTTIGWIESDFKPTTRGRGEGRRKAEVGIWQLIPYDSPVQAARRYLMATPTPAPDVRRLRKRSGHFSILELRDLKLGTWIAGFEMASHVKSCKKRHPSGHFLSNGRYHCRWMRRWAKRNPRTVPMAVELSRYGHYNSGGQPPTCAYLWKLFSRYAKMVHRYCPAEKADSKTSVSARSSGKRAGVLPLRKNRRTR